MSFNLKDYQKMFKARGIRLPINYFIQNQFFDLWNKTNTHYWLPKNQYKFKPKNFSDGVLYMSSWTSIIKNATYKAIDYLKTNDSYQLIDIGCGKGKVLCVWEKMFKWNNVELFGVEYNQELSKICLENLKKIKSRRTSVKIMDALELDFDEFDNSMIIYLFNPFNQKILEPFLNKLKNKSVVAIYNNPIHDYIFRDNHFILKYKKNGWHPNATYNIYTNY